MCLTHRSVRGSTLMSIFSNKKFFSSYHGDRTYTGELP
jgi:hypothetical protein